MPELGQPGIVINKLERFYNPSDLVCWNRHYINQPGIYVGIRRLKEGRRIFSREEGTYFKQTGTKVVYLVVINEHQNPIYVSPEDFVPSILTRGELFQCKRRSIDCLKVAEKYIKDTIALLQEDK
jgi:hypothetical protein